MAVLAAPPHYLLELGVLANGRPARHSFYRTSSRTLEGIMRLPLVLFPARALAIFCALGVFLAACDGSPADPTKPGPLEFASVSTGGGHTCGLTTSGAAYCWGANEYGQLGDGTTTSSLIPVKVSGNLTFRSVNVAGGGEDSYSCGVTTEGNGYCWGSNRYGGLGTGSAAGSSTPVRVSGGITFREIAVGHRHACGVSTQNQAYCWGRNAAGQLGTGDTVDSSTPVQVSGGLAFESVGVGGSPVPLLSGDGRSCGLTTGGAAYCWGNNTYGQLGDGTTEARTTPTPVVGGLSFRALSVGFFHTCGLTASGAAYCWGNNFYGQLARDPGGMSSEPVSAAEDLSFAAISAGNAQTCGISTQGATFCWGAGQDGELGNGSFLEKSAVPVKVEGSLAFRMISVGEGYTCGVTESGAGYCWGYNSSGRLGNGTTEPSNVPVPIQTP